METIQGPHIELSKTENELVQHLKLFCKHLRNSRPDLPSCECRIAGGWVRDKLLGLTTTDMDVSLSSLTGSTFATLFLEYLTSIGVISPCDSEPHIIAANPAKSKALETARKNILGIELDFVQLRTESYNTDSRIPDVTFGTPFQDAMRRDLTINSLFYNIHDCRVEDHTGLGLHDLLRHSVRPFIRTPLRAEVTFRDDPLRLLRSIRFASRFGGIVHDDIFAAARNTMIREALMTKISRERVGSEVIKMLQVPDPVYSMRMIHRMDIYSLMFYAPAVQTATTASAMTRLAENDSLTNSYRSSSGMTLQLSSLMSDLLCLPLRPGSMEVTYPYAIMPHALLYNFMPPEKERQKMLLQRLWLAAALVPWRHATYYLQKREVPVLENVIREGLKLSIEDVQHVSSLYAAADIISTPSLDKFSLPNETTALALLFRDPVVSMSKLGGSFSRGWQVSTFFSLCLDIFDQVSQGHSVGSCKVGDVIKQYNTLMCKVQELDIEQLATQKCLINGKDLANLLQENGYKAGPSTAVLLQRCLVWQFDHLTGTKEECETWLLDNWREIVDESTSAGKR